MKITFIECKQINNLKKNEMKNLKLVTIATCLFAFMFSIKVNAQDNMMKQDTKMVGGAEMYPTKNIVENAVNSKDHTTLVAAVKAADLVDALSSEGPFTVFAPTNSAFDKLPKGTVDNLLMMENKMMLKSILKYHVVSGKWNAKDIMKMIKKGNGKAKIETLSGGTITAWMKGDAVYITDENGNSAQVTITDVNQSNGVIHVVDTVLLPKS